MKNQTITAEQLKSILEAINHPDYSHASCRVMGIIGIYHKNHKYGGVDCKTCMPEEFSFLLTNVGKSYRYNPEFGLITP
jgi:hypothetical protein